MCGLRREASQKKDADSFESEVMLGSLGASGSYEEAQGSKIYGVEESPLKKQQDAQDFHKSLLPRFWICPGFRMIPVSSLCKLWLVHGSCSLEVSITLTALQFFTIHLIT